MSFVVVGEEVEEDDGGVHAPSSESQFPLSVLGSDLHTQPATPAADVGTQRTDPGSDSCPTANNTERGGGGEGKEGKILGEEEGGGAFSFLGVVKTAAG